jgi:hypothetical protein
MSYLVLTKTTRRHARRNRFRKRQASAWQEHQIKVPWKVRIFTLLVSLWDLLDPILGADVFRRDHRWMIPYFGQGNDDDSCRLAPVTLGE